MEDYLVYYNNKLNPLEEFYDSEKLIVEIHTYDFDNNREIYMDIYTCPNLQTQFPVMKIYTYLDVDVFNTLEDHEYMNAEIDKDTVKVVSYLSLKEARYVTCIDINNNILFKNYKFNKAEILCIIRAMNIPSDTVFRTTYSDMIDKINSFFIDIEDKANSITKYRTDTAAKIYNISESRINKPIYKYHFYGSNMPNYGSLIKKGA